MQRNIKTCLITIMLVLMVLFVQAVDAFLDEFKRKKLGDDWTVDGGAAKEPGTDSALLRLRRGRHDVRRKEIMRHEGQLDQSRYRYRGSQAFWRTASVRRWRFTTRPNTRPHWPLGVWREMKPTSFSVPYVQLRCHSREDSIDPATPKPSSMLCYDT